MFKNTPESATKVADTAKGTIDIQQKVIITWPSFKNSKVFFIQTRLSVKMAQDQSKANQLGRVPGVFQDSLSPVKVNRNLTQQQHPETLKPNRIINSSISL